MSHILSQINSQVNRLYNRTKDILFAQPFESFWRQRLNGKVMVYLYHRIDEIGDWEYLDQGGSPTTPLDEFNNDLLYLKHLDATFIRFEDLSKLEIKQDTFYVIICFDDGFASNYKQAAKLLSELSIPATVFQCSAMISSKQLIWEHQLYWLFYHREYKSAFRQFLTVNFPDWPDDCGEIREQIQPTKIYNAINSYLSENSQIQDKIEKEPHRIYPSIESIQNAYHQGIEIGSHGNQHLKRSNISDDEFINELISSKRDLGEITDQPPVSFSYPFNSYLDNDSKICSDYYHQVATVDGGAITSQTSLTKLPRNTWPGLSKNTLRHRRWLLTGRI